MSYFCMDRLLFIYLWQSPVSCSHAFCLSNLFQVLLFVFLVPLFLEIRMLSFYKWSIQPRGRHKGWHPAEKKQQPGPHLNDTDLVGLDHHFPKLCGDQDLTLLGDYRDANRQRETDTRKSERRIGPPGELSYHPSCER